MLIAINAGYGNLDLSGFKGICAVTLFNSKHQICGNSGLSLNIISLLIQFLFSSYILWFQDMIIYHKPRIIMSYIYILLFPNFF